MNELRDLERVAKAELGPLWRRIGLFRIDQCESRAEYVVRIYWRDLRGDWLGHRLGLSAKSVFAGHAWAAVYDFARRTVRSIRLFDAMQSLVLPWMPVEEPVPPEPGPEWCPR